MALQKHTRSYKTTCPHETQTRTQAERREETREELLAAAARVFAHRGFHATSLDAVAEEAGFSRGAVYYNFADKEELFLELLDRRCAERGQDLREVFADTDDEDVEATSRQAQLGRPHALDAMTGDPEWRALYLEFLAHAARDTAFRRRFSSAPTRCAARSKRSSSSAAAPSPTRSGWSPNSSRS